jgi:hypothetical protein
MSAKTLGIKNYTTCQYWLKVEFIGYDLEGLPKKRITIKNFLKNYKKSSFSKITHMTIYRYNWQTANKN